MNQERVNLLITMADANYISQAKQLFSSVYFNAGWAGDYMLLTNNLSQQDTLWFELRGIIVYDQPLLTQIPLGSKAYPPILLSKFYLFQEYFKKWNKIIYLDADIIVEASLDGLTKLSGFNAPVATTFRLKNEFVDNKQALKKLKQIYNLHSQAFNSGVFVLDTELLTNNTYNEIIDLYNNYQDISEYGEESILNLFFYQKWKLLPLVYNFVPWYVRKTYGVNNTLFAVVIHFVCAKIKPWDKNSSHYQKWSDNLKKAEDINLFARPKATKIMSEKQIRRYLYYLKLRLFLNFWYRPVYLIYTKIFYLTDRQIGRLGLYLKEHKPALYYRLIKFKKTIF